MEAVNRSQLLNELAERNAPMMSREEADEILTSLTDLITDNGGDRRRRGDLRFREVPPHRPPGAHGVATPRPARRSASRPSATRSITPLKAFKDAVLSGKAPRRRTPPPRRHRREGSAEEGPGARRPGEEGTGHEEGSPPRRRQPSAARSPPCGHHRTSPGRMPGLVRAVRSAVVIGARG